MTAFLRIVSLLCAFLALLTPVLASDSQTVPATRSVPILKIRAGIHSDYDRLVVDWPRPVGYTVHRDGVHVSVEFKASGQAEWQDVMVAQPTRAQGFLSSTDKNGDLTISFNIGLQATVSDFTSGNSVVIDIGGEKAKKAETKQPAPAIIQPVQQSVTTTPAAKENTAPILSSPPTAPPPTSTIPLPPAIINPVSEKPPVSMSLPAETVQVPSKSVVLNKQIAFPVIGDTPLLIASFDPHIPLPVAVYQRGGYAYIVFDRKLTIALDSLTSGQSAPLIPLEEMDLPKASAYRFPVPPNVELRAARNDNVWQVFLSHLQPDVPVSFTLVAQPDFALGARFLLPLPDSPEPVHLTDPVIGDDLIAVPMQQMQSFSVGRSMADFDILPAAQGLVVKPLIDKLVVRAVTDGIEITAEGGLHLSSANDTGLAQESSQRAREAAAGKSMFDFSVWRGKADETFTETRQRLQQTIVDVPEEERDRARLELARFYFVNAEGEEAAALLAYLVKLVPDIAAHADFRALNGAAEILAWRPDEGLKQLDSPSLIGQPEIELWQAVALAELRNWDEAEQKFEITENMLDDYPEPFYSRFSILSIESALAVGKDHEAADWLDRLQNGRHSDRIDPALEYLQGVLDAKTGHAEKAEQEWKDVTQSNDDLYRVRARLALIDLGIATHSLTPAQAADQLESLRFAWRGDDLELDILHRLGEFYVQAHNAKAGLNTLARAVQLYPNSTMTPAIHQEMVRIFRDVFLNDPANSLTPLDALTLYEQYRDLMPEGQDGIAIMKKLAERLVQIDLLDQAAGLLESLVKDKLQGEEKGRVSARLSAIRLLNHEPDKAMEALDMSDSNSYPRDLLNDRILLRARILLETKKYDDALALIKDNETQPAEILRAEIDMRAQRWPDAAQSLLTLIGIPPPSGVPLAPEKADWLVNCAIAASLANDTAGLEKLRADYGEAIASLPQHDTFRMLTEPDGGDESKDIAAAQARIADVDMFQGFLDAYRKNEAVTGIGAASPGPSSATAPPTPAAAKP